MKVSVGVVEETGRFVEVTDGTLTPSRVKGFRLGYDPCRVSYTSESPFPIVTGNQRP